MRRKIRILELKNYTIPFYGNRRNLPYFTLEIVVTEKGNAVTKEVVTKEDDEGRRYFVHNRRRYYVENIGSLYSPKIKLI